MIYENRLADDSHEISYLIFFRKLGKMSQNLSSAAVVIGALRVKVFRGNEICLVYKNFQGNQGIRTSDTLIGYLPIF